MDQEILRITSIRQLHEVFDLTLPIHPLVSIVDVSKWEIPEKFVGQKIITDLYSIALKDENCGLSYGRNKYDFNKGVLIFTAPKQLQMLSKVQKLNEIRGWMLFIHPELIFNTSLVKKIEHYPFFSYDVHEALHLSDLEKQNITKCIDLIANEINQSKDHYSQSIIANVLELLLNLSQRYYERQFNTRKIENTHVLSQFQILLREYYDQGFFIENGQPTVEYFAKRLNISSNYFGDLIKKETGFTAKDYLSDYIVEKAKILLLSNTESISEIAYSLGFNYPHYFSRMFKSKTGMTPKKYRQIN